MPGLFKRLGANSASFLFFIILPICGLSLFSNPAQAAELEESLIVTVTATVVDDDTPEEQSSTISFKGLAYPSSLVIIKQSGELLSAISTTTRAKFSVSEEVDPGFYTFRVHGLDARGIHGKAVKFITLISDGTATTLSGIFLPPTIVLNKKTISKAKRIKIYGTSSLNKRIIIKVRPGPQTFRTKTHRRGRWHKYIPGSALALGRHSVKVRARKTNGTRSPCSKKKWFKVTRPQTLSTCELAAEGDINCDSFVDLLDLSLMQLYWEQTVAAGNRADINGDGQVNILDFSLLMYYWTGSLEEEEVEE